MKLHNLLFLLLTSLNVAAQDSPKPKDRSEEKNRPEEKINKLKDVSFGFAAGFTRNFKDVYDYSLSQSDYSLQRQSLSRGSFVISSMISIKLTPLQKDERTNQMQSQKEGSEGSADFDERISLNVGLNLMEISNSVQFNKSIDGGIGVGFYAQENTQIALMFEVSSVRQIRESIEKAYLGKPIPKESSFYNALDRQDDNLFYNKLITGLSVKIVFSL